MASHEIYIYGDIVPFHCGWGDEYSLADLNAALAALSVAEGDELVFNIHTFGGCTATAFGIYNKLKRFATEAKISLTSRVDGWCASSGVIILLAGDRRIGNAYAEPFIHNAWTVTMGDKNEVMKIAESLARTDDQIATLYAERTSISKEEAVALMNADDFVSAERALELGFFTELENIEVGEIEIMNSIKSRNLQIRKNNTTNMADKNKNSAWNKLKKDIDNFFGRQNKIVFTADNSELDFYELGENDTPAVGDKAKFDGKPAGETNGGEYVMQSGETYKFEGEELKTIVPAEDTAGLEAENTALKEEVARLQQEIESQKNSHADLSSRISAAERIIKDFKDLESEVPEPGQQRTPKSTPEPTKRNLFKHVK